jgi:hypothetical protein
VDRAAPSPLVHHQARRSGAGSAAFIAAMRKGFSKEDIVKGLADREKAFEAEFKRNQEAGVPGYRSP